MSEVKLKKLIILFSIVISAKSIAQSNDRFFPVQALVSEKYFSHHILIAEKSTHQIHLFENNDGKAVLLKSFQMASGKKSGDKSKEGDFKTPEGIYYFDNFMTKNALLKKVGKEAKIYGAGAFISNYPNEIDKIYHKKGSGIWLHSTNDETRIDKGLDSRGCVVMNNKDLIEISKYIELNKTPFIITQDLQFLRNDSHDLLKKELEDFLASWVSSWKNKDINTFMSHYDSEHFIDSKGNFNKFKQYKSAVFSIPGSPKIEISHVSILNEKKYAVITFIQNYQSLTINDLGKKELYVVKNPEGNWQILRETWSKEGIDEHLNIAFEPKAKFFTSN